MCGGCCVCVREGGDELGCGGCVGGRRGGVEVYCARGDGWGDLSVCGG